MLAKVKALPSMEQLQALLRAVAGVVVIAGAP